MNSPNRNSPAPAAPPLAPPPRKPLKLRPLIVALLVVLVLVTVLALVARRPRTPAKPAPATTAVTPATQTDTTPATPHAGAAAPATPAPGQAVVPPQTGVYARVVSVTTNAPAKAPEAGVVRRLRGEKRPPRKVVPGLIMATNRPNPLATLHTTSERIISNLLSIQPGDVVIDFGLGSNFAADFAASLTNIIEIYETDTPEEAAHKEAIAWMKDDMRKMVEEGHAPEDIIAAYRQELREIMEYRNGLQQQLNQIRREGTPEEAAEFVEEANKILAEYGARPLRLPLLRVPANR